MEDKFNVSAFWEVERGFSIIFIYSSADQFADSIKPLTFLKFLNHSDEYLKYLSSINCFIRINYTSQNIVIRILVHFSNIWFIRSQLTYPRLIISAADVSYCQRWGALLANTLV